MPPKKSKTAKPKDAGNDDTNFARTNAFRSSRVEKYYSRIVAGFVLVTIGLVALIGYFSFSKTGVVVHPSILSGEFTVKASLENLGGVIVLTDVEGSKVFTGLSDTSTVTSGKAVGTVNLVNNYTSDQPLVETTRLLSSEGVLFRTTETVTVPAGGSVTVGVEADESGAVGDIGPSKFEVVALWDGLKDDIYGTSSQSMSGGVKQVAVVSNENIQAAKLALREELREKAKAVFAEEVPSYEGMPSNTRILDTYTVVATQVDDTDAQPGDEVPSITATQKLTVATPVIDADRLVSILKDGLSEQLPIGVEFVSDVTLDNVEITLQDLSDDYSTATIVLQVTADTIINEDNSLLDKSKLTNKSESDVASYLSAFEEIESVDLSFSPFWVTRTPSVADHISISVE